MTLACSSSGRRLFIFHKVTGLGHKIRSQSFLYLLFVYVGSIK